MDIKEYFKKEQKGFYSIIQETLTSERREQLYDAINDWHESELKLLGIPDKGIYKIKLPIQDDYYTFANNYDKSIGKREIVYKLSFTDGYFYIGCTSNLASRMYYHVTMEDANNCKNLTKKHKRMIKAIDNLETVKFEIIGTNMSDERKFILEGKKDSKCLNMANGMGKA